MKYILRIAFPLLFCILLCACGTEVPEDDRSTVFREQIIALRTGECVAEPSGMVFDGETVCVRTKSGSDQYAKAAVDIAGNPVYDTTLAPHSSVMGAYNGGARVSEVFRLENGERIVFETNYSDTDADAWAVLRGADEVIFSAAPAADLGHEVRTGNLMAGDNVFAVTDAVSVTVGTDTRYVLLTTEGLCAYTADGVLCWTIHDRNTFDIVVSREMLLLLTCDENGQVLYRIDAADGTKTAIPYPDIAADFCALGDRETDVLITGGGHDLYASNISGLYALDFSEENGAMTAAVTPIINWTQSGLIPNAIHDICVVDAETVFLVTDDLSGAGGGNVLARYTMVPTDEIPEKQELVLALFQTRTSYQLPVFYFNRASDTHRIVIRDYTMYEGEERMLHFNADIASGDVPDMVIMFENASGANTMISTYERSGLFADLTPILQATPEFRYDELLSYITEPYKLGGKQYLFPLTPEANAYFGSPELFDGPVTVDEYLDICEENGLASFGGMSLFGAAIDDHYDEETAVCTFDDGTLQAQMERSEQLKQNTGVQPLKMLHMSYPTLWHYVKALHDAGEPLVPVGAPNAQRTMTADYMLSELFAITTTCRDTAAAAAFLQMLMERQYVQPIDMQEVSMRGGYFSGVFGYTFYAEQITEQLAQFDGKTVVADNGQFYLYENGDPALETVAGVRVTITEEDAAAYTAYLNSIQRRVNQNSPAQDLFWNEYWSMRDRPTEELLRIVQSKISIYLSEQQK